MNLDRPFHDPSRNHAWLHPKRRVRLTRILTVLLLLGAYGCGGRPDVTGRDGHSIRQKVASGFHKSASGLFVASQRLGQMLEHLGYDPKEYSYACDHSSDGRSLRCWNYDRTRAVLITKGRQARLLHTPAGALLDDRDNVIAWYGKNAGDHRITFPNGKVMNAPGFHVDSAGRFFCYGGDYYDYGTRARRTAPIRLAAVDDPEKALVTSQLQGILAGIYVADDKLYVMARANTGQTPDHLICEEYECDGPALTFKRQFEVRCPGKRAAHVVPMDFDPRRLRFLVKADREMPASGPIWYVYDVRTDHFEEVGVFEGYAGFLDRHVFDRALEGPQAGGLKGVRT